MRLRHGLLTLAFLGCGAGAKERPHPAEEPLVVSQAATRIQEPTAGGAHAGGINPPPPADYPPLGYPQKSLPGLSKASPAAPPPHAEQIINKGPIPDMSGVLVGSRADMSAPLQGVQPGRFGYIVPATRPFMGLKLADNSFVSVVDGKIIEVTNGIDPASCEKLFQKLSATYGPAKVSFTQNTWKVAAADIGLMKATGVCSIMIKLAR